MKKSLISAILFLLPFMSIAEIPDWVKNPPKGEYIGISFIDDDYLKEESALISAFTAYMLDQPHNEVDSTKRNLVGYGTLYNDSIKFDIARIAVLPTNEIAVSIKKGEQNNIDDVFICAYNDTIGIGTALYSKNLFANYVFDDRYFYSFLNEINRLNGKTIRTYFDCSFTDTTHKVIQALSYPGYETKAQIKDSCQRKELTKEETKSFLQQAYSILEPPYVTSIRKKIFEQEIENFEQDILNALNSNQEDDNGIKEEISQEEKDKMDKLMKEFKEEILRALSPYAELEFDGYKSGDNVLMFNYQGIFKKTNSLGLSYLYTLCHIQCCKDWFTYQKIDKKPVYPDKEYCLPPLTVNQISIIGDELYIFIDRPEELIIPINNNR